MKDNVKQRTAKNREVQAARNERLKQAKQFSKRYEQLFLELNERQKRLVVASDVKSLGLSITEASRLSKMSRKTIYKALRELESGEVFNEGVRKKGGGRKTAKDKYPALKEALEKLLSPVTRGEPTSPLRWTSKSLENLAVELRKQGYKVSRNVVGRLLHSEGYSLQSNKKRNEGKKEHPDRDLQFRYINRLTKLFLSQKEPVISVDTKKKELVGNYKNNGKEWRPKGKPEEVLVHDFIDPENPKAIPYGVYDIGNNLGYVNVGIDHDTAEFAVSSILRWWNSIGKKFFANKKRIMICADSGGSNGYRVKLWKVCLSRLANTIEKEIVVCHFPPGTSKWNKIEHRMFSFITKNWRGKPLLSYQLIINLISSTKTKTGLKIKAKLDTRTYQKGIKVSDEEFDNIKIKKSRFHPEWNYTIYPS
jgi:transposase